MKKVINIAELESALLNIGLQDSDIDIYLDSAKKYNKGLIKLHTSINSSGYTLDALLTDTGMDVETKSISYDLVKCFDNKGITQHNRYEIIFTNTGSIYSFPYTPPYLPKYEGNVCEMIFSVVLREKYFKKNFYTPYWINRAILEYRKRLRRNGYRPIKFIQLKLEIQKSIIILLN